MKRIGSFVCDDALCMSRIDGEIAERLGCDPIDLREFGWQPFLVKGDWPSVRQMGIDFQQGRAGRYGVRARSKTGEVLHLAISTVVVPGKGRDRIAGGSLDLVAREVNRRIYLP